MARGADTFLKFSAAVSLLLAAGSVGYYFAVYLPARDAKLDDDRRLERANADLARQAEEARRQTGRRSNSIIRGA